MNYALNSTEVFGSRIRSGQRPKSSQNRSALATWTRTPDVWSSTHRNEKRCVNWDVALGIASVALVSAAGWAGIVLTISRLIR